nr:MAG TPA: hypothetical protein [Caudoviricetes sp.]
MFYLCNCKTSVTCYKTFIIYKDKENEPNKKEKDNKNVD